MNFRIWLCGMLSLGLSACAYAETKVVTESDVTSFAESQRTTNCVLAGLPMEVQFSLPDNPPRLAVSTLSWLDIDRVIQHLDSRVSTLLREAGQISFKEVHGHTRGSSLFGTQMNDAISAHITKRASKKFNLWFCGNEDVVGANVVASISSYFSRTLDVGPGKQPIWVDKLSSTGQSKATSIVTVAVALRLAGIEYNLTELIQSFNQ